MWRGVSQSGNLADCWGIAQKVGASRTGEVQITRPWQGPAQLAGTNVKGPTGGLARIVIRHRTWLRCVRSSFRFR